MPGFWLYPLCYQIISISWGPTYVPQIQTNAFDDYNSQTWRASPIFTFASAHHLHNRVQPWPLLISTQNHKHDSPMFSFTLFQKKRSLRSSETGGSLVILTFSTPSTKHTSAGNRRFIGLASSGPSGRRAIPVRILVMASNLGGLCRTLGHTTFPEDIPGRLWAFNFFLGSTASTASIVHLWTKANLMRSQEQTTWHSTKQHSLVRSLLWSLNSLNTFTVTCCYLLQIGMIGRSPKNHSSLAKA